MILNLDLTDVWRDPSAECMRFTWRGQAPQLQLLDFFFLFSFFSPPSPFPESLVPYVEQTDIMYGYRSDYFIVVLKFVFGKEEIKRKTFWKFYTALLKDYGYLKEINEEIKNAVILYDTNEIHNMQTSDIQFTISNQLFLDVLVMKIRSKTIPFATMKKRKTKEQ